MYMYMYLLTLTEPEVLDFGSAIVDSVIEKTISIKNYSQKHICVRMEVRYAICESQPELKQFQLMLK